MKERKFREHEQDRRILAALTRNARITNRDLAKELDIPEHVASDRLRVLQSNGIVGTTVLVDYAAFGYSPFLNLQLAVEPGRFEEAASFLTEIESIVTLYSWGRFADHQFGLHVVARTLVQAQSLLADQIGRCPGMTRCDVHVMTGATNYNPPIVVSGVRAGPGPEIEPHDNVDELDVSIIECLRNEGRKPYLTIADNLGVVEGTVRRRVVRMVEERIIRFAPVVSGQSLMPRSLPIVVWIDVDPEHIEAASKVLQGAPYVAGLQRLLGPRGNLLTTVSIDEQQAEQALSELAVNVPGLRNIYVEPVKRVFKFSDTWRDLAGVQPLPIDIWAPDASTE